VEKRTDSDENELELQKIGKWNQDWSQDKSDNRK